MLNTLKIGDITSKVTFNTPCTGLIQKSHPRSNFVRFHAKSQLANWVFSSYPRLVEETCNIKKIIVLQVMVFGDNEMLIEYVYEKDLKEE